MAKNDRWLPFYVGDYLADTMHLSCLEHGAYLLLLFQYWKTGALPDNDATLAKIVKVDLKVWKKEIAPIVRPFFERQDDGLLHQKRMDIERAKTAHLSEVRRKVGAKGKGGSADKQLHEQLPVQLQGQKHDQNGEQTDGNSTSNSTSNSSSNSSSNCGHTRVVARQLPSQRKENNNSRSPDAARARVDATMPRIGDPPEAWEPLAEGWSTDRDGVRRPTRNGDFVDVAAGLVLDAARLNPETFRQDWRPLIGWMDAGIDAVDIEAAIRQVAAQPTYDPSKVATLAYFDRAVRARKASET